MSRLSKNETGFSMVELVTTIILVALVGSVGWLTYKNHGAGTRLIPTPSTKKASTSDTAGPSVLAIKEWGIKLSLTGPIYGATYHLIGNTAWLSTPALDKNTTCYDPTSSFPTFASIVRYKPNDTVTVIDNPNSGDNYMTATKAVGFGGGLYKSIGSYVYYFQQGKGTPCMEETVAQENAFDSTFNTIKLN